MPVQDLEHWPRAEAACRRTLALRHPCLRAGSCSRRPGDLTGLGTYEIYQVISPADVTWLQVMFAALFAMTFAWIAFACAGAVLGFS